MVVADNSGARVAMIIGMTKKPAAVATIGRVVKVTIKAVRSGGAAAAAAAASGQGAAAPPKVRPGEVHNALVIRCRQGLARADGRTLRFDDNACVLLGPDMKPIGSRVIGPVPMELKKGNWLKVLSLSSRII